MYFLQVTAGVLWLLSGFLLLGVIFITYPLMQLDWDNQLVDNLVNSFKRPLWAVGVSCLIFVCEHGYGGKFILLIKSRVPEFISIYSHSI